MSRLTASPFHKPSPFEFPRTLPVSPPETNSDSAGPSGPIHEATVSVAGGIEALQESDFLHFQHSATDSMGTRLRRGPSLPYHSSGIREAKEKTVQRSLKSFIIVVPPSILLQDHGQLGHTLSLGPRHRLAQGMLMPLFPTMYGQLAAIAREYSFPSTAGLCIYLHYSENGVTSTPRISDDSWQMVWSPFLDAAQHSPRPPICGKVEFDIDLRYARWYHAWISSSHREQMDVPMSVVPSTAPSVTHFRTDSRNTDADITPHNDHGEGISVTPQSTARHIPKKLSLVDRLDIITTRSISRPPSRDRSGLSPPEQVIPSQVLSPVFQEDEPKTAKQDLEKRVNNWRVSASLTATSLASKQGQVSLEPANIPNNVSLDNVPDYEDGELNLGDFVWSVSSQGPGDYDEAISIFSWDKTPSVHLASRLQGSVCMTPSTATSFGPSDYTLPSPIPSSARPLTPDLGYRLYEDVPATPTTATSWGPPSEYPPSMYSTRSISSVDLAYRLTFSRPVTPTTATSWGPSSWPSSPVESISGRAISVHLDDRGSFSRPTTPTTATTWGPPSWPSSPVESIKSDAISIHLGDRGSFSPPLTPSTTGAPLSYPSPASAFYVPTSDTGERIFEEGPLQKQLPHNWPDQGTAEHDATPWAHGWPRITKATNHGWPYHSSTRGPPLTLQSSRVTKSSINWVHNWPYQVFNSVGHSLSANGGCVWPIPNDPWKHGWPYAQKAVIAHMKDSTNKTMRVRVDLHSQKADSHKSGVDLHLGYPYFRLYPIGYPYNLECIYPRAIGTRLTDSQPGTIGSAKFLKRVSGYPCNLYQIYPAVSGHAAKMEQAQNHVIVRLKSSYPNFDLYPAIYPGNLAEIYPRSTECPPSRSLERQQTVDVRVVRPYPISQIYPAVYPWNLEEIYPISVIQGNDIKNGPGYPFFNLYPAVYPHFDLYPPIDLSVADSTVKPLILVDVEVRYPTMVIYRPVYPFLLVYANMPEDILNSKTPLAILLCKYIYPEITVYPPLSDAVESNGHLPTPLVDLSLSNYPFFDLYPPTYPHFNIYPPISGEMDSKDIVLDVIVNYPVFDLYPAVYPYINVYPPVSGIMDSVCDIRKNAGTTVNYPAFILYPAVYPHFNLYPPISGLTVEQYIDLRLPAKYPAFELYAPVYPSLPLIQPLMESSLTVTRTRKTHAQLHHLVLLEAPRRKKLNAELHHEVLRSVEVTGKPKRSKTHLELHEEVSLRSACVNTPNGTPTVLRMHAESQPSVPQPTRTRSGPISRRPVSIVPPPTRGLPPRPDSLVAEPAGIQPNHNRRPRVSSPEHSFSSVVQPLRRSASSTTSGSRAYALHKINTLPPVDERDNTSLTRSSSLSDVSRDRHRTSDSTVSPTPLPRKRDSLVQQRVRLINAGSEDDDSSMLSLASRFPMPPRPLPPPPL